MEVKRESEAGEANQTRDIVRVVEGQRWDNPIEGAYRVTKEVLAELQKWTAEEAENPGRYVLVTKMAVATESAEEVQGLQQAALWGLLRTARNEYPERALVLLDTDGSEASQGALASAILADDEPEAA